MKAGINPVLHRHFIVSEQLHTGSASRVGVGVAQDRNRPARAAIKQADWEGIDGNGRPWVLAQAKYMAAMADELGPRIVPRVYVIIEGPGAAVYFMEYLEDAATNAERLLGNPNTTLRDVFAVMDDFIGFMDKRVYSRRPIVSRPAEILKAHLKRMERRLSLVTDPPPEIYSRLMKGHPVEIGEAQYQDISLLFKDLLKQPAITINGANYPNLPSLIQILKSRRRDLEKSLGESHYPAFRHGDMSFRNALYMPDGSYRLIDLRGKGNLRRKTAPDISIEYEIGKLTHSLLSDVLERGLFSVALKRGSQGWEIEAGVPIQSTGAKAFLSADDFIDHYLRGQANLRRLLGSEVEAWVSQIRLAEAAHFAANIINRINEDKSGRHAVMYYVYSVLAFTRYLQEYGFMLPGFAPQGEYPRIYQALARAA